MDQDKCILFCFPYAGGSSSIYHRWKAKIPDFIRLRPVELAGRGTRVGHPFYTTMEEAVNDIIDITVSEIIDETYAFFGHSMGANIAYELACKIKQQGLPLPIHLFLSGTVPPDRRQIKKNYTEMSDKLFKEELKRIGGTPEEFFQTQELLDFFLPILKHDFTLAFSTNRLSTPVRIATNIDVLYGTKDDFQVSDYEG